MADVSTLDGVNMVALAYRAKYDNDKKANANKANFLSYFFGNRLCHHTTRYPAEKKLNYLYGTRAPSNFINCCKFVEEYYDGMPASDKVSRNTHFLLGIEEAVRTTSIFKITPCYIIVVYASNDFGLARSFSPI